MELPQTAHLFLTITPKTEADQERFGQGLDKLMAEALTLRVKTGTTGGVVIGAVGELARDHRSLEARVQR